MIWYVKVLIAIVAALSLGFIYMFVRHKWRWADIFFVVFPIAMALVFWWIFNFWIGLTFYVAYGWVYNKVMDGDVHGPRGEHVIFGYDESTYLRCTECDYEHLTVEYKENHIIKTHCNRCGHDDIYETDPFFRKIG